MSLRTLVFLSAGLAAAGIARADTDVCIESTQALYNAFDAIDGDNTGFVRLKIRTGTFTIGSELQLDYRGDDGDVNRSHQKMTISGGWGPGCTSQTAALGATTLTAPSGRGSVNIELNGNSLDFNSITLQNVSLSIDNWLCYNNHYEEGNVATIRQSRLLNSRIFLGSPCHSYGIYQSLITSRADNVDDIVIGWSPFWDPPTTPQNFTMVGSTVRDGTVRVEIQEAGGNPPQTRVKLQNNVFENDGAEVAINGGDVFAIRNRYDSLIVTNGTLAQNEGNIAAPALLQSNSVPSNTSPLVNAGSRFIDGGLPPIDLAANPREIGTKPDIGAFETAVNDIAVFEVTNTQSSGVGSLAQAVASANAFNGAQSIEFNIAGGCPRIITLTSTLNITDELRIRGNTQPGTVFNTLDFGAYNGAPCIVLQAGAGVSDAFNFNSSEANDDFEVFNVGFSGFSTSGITLRSGTGHRVAGVQFGGAINAFTLQDVSFGVRVIDDAGGTEIGGPDLRSVNLLGNTNLAIFLSGTGSNQVLGNAIGSRGLDDLGNQTGILVSSPSNIIRDNRVVLSTSPNLVISGSAARLNIVTGNTFGAGDSHGITISNGANSNRVGPENAITGNGGNGVLIASGGRNQVRENQIGSNGLLGIDLGGDGVTANNDDPSNATLTGLANREQNYPVLETVRRVVIGTQPYVILDGSLRTTPGVYAIDVFRVSSCDASNHGEGAALIGSVTLDVGCTISQNGQCTEPLNVILPEDDFDTTDSISLTATSPGGNTSEFSECYRQNPDHSITITNNRSSVTANTLINYTVVARNVGFTPVGGERVRLNFPAVCVNPIWTCVGESGGSCAGSGVGNINDGSVALPIGSRVTYTASCPLIPTATGTLDMTATISSVRTDLTPANNTATDSDPIVATALAVGSVSVTEGTGGNTSFNFNVVATPTPQSEVTVNYATANGTAVAGSDYTAATGTLTFAPGVSSRSVRIIVSPDRIVEGNETLTINLSDPTNALLADASAVGTINNDDTATLSLNAVARDEGNTGTSNLGFLATLSNPVQGVVSARVDTLDGNSATESRNARVADNDYIAIVDGAVQIASSTTQRGISVQIVGDLTPESSESFRLRLTNLDIPATIAPGDITFGDNLGIGTINNDDGFPTTTTINSTSPNPSLVNQPYTVAVRVASSSNSPSGQVTISDGEVSCTLTLSPSLPPSSLGSCQLSSTTPGLKTLTATFSPATSLFATSTGTTSHQVNPDDLIFEDGFE